MQHAPQKPFLRRIKICFIQLEKQRRCWALPPLPCAITTRRGCCRLSSDSTIGERLEILAAQRESVKTQISELERHLKMIDYKVWYYETAQKAGTTTVMDNYPEEEIPEQFREFRAKKYSN